jgi:hypothetical protein
MEWLRKVTKSAFRTFDTLNDIRNDHLPNTSQGQYRYCNPFGCFLLVLQCCAVNIHCCLVAQEHKEGTTQCGSKCRQGDWPLLPDVLCLTITGDEAWVCHFTPTSAERKHATFSAIRQACFCGEGEVEGIFYFTVHSLPSDSGPQINQECMPLL